MEFDADICIVGAGAAGLTAAIFAAEMAVECSASLRILLIDGATKPGAKILVSGGGRCNVTNQSVTEHDFFGGPQTIIRNVLKAFGEKQTLEWMQSTLGVPLKLEPTGKWFPQSDKARTVLDALLGAVAARGIELRAGWRVREIKPMPDGFEIEVSARAECLRAHCVILATGGLSLPKSGSDGLGLQWAESLGHTVVKTTPALVPLILNHSGDKGPGSRLHELSGITLDVRLVLTSTAGKKLFENTGSLVFTHFGFSGPAVLDFSRHVLRWRLENPGEKDSVTMGHPDFTSVQHADSWLLGEIQAGPSRSVSTVVSAVYPERLARLLADGLPDRIASLTREQRLELARRLAALPVIVSGDRGYSFAETTAGGVSLREIEPKSMASRKVPNLFLCGEMLDVDGRIGGFNFQWAWSSGYLAGRAAARAVALGVRDSDKG